MKEYKYLHKRNENAYTINMLVPFAVIEVVVVVTVVTENITQCVNKIFSFKILLMAFIRNAFKVYIFNENKRKIEDEGFSMCY